MARQSAAVLLQAAVMLLAGVLWVVPRASSWIGSWKQALDFAAGATAFIGPVAAGAAVLACARVRRSAMSDLMAQGLRDWRAWIQPAAALWVLASTALLVVALAATTLASLAGVPSYWSSSWVVLPALAVLAAQVAIGAALGFASGRAWTAPLVVAGVYSIALLSSAQLIPEVFDTGGVTGTLGGQRFVVGPVLAPGIAALGIAAVVLAAANPRVLLATWPRRAVVGAGSVAFLVGWWIVPPDNDHRYALLTDPPLTCAGAQPQVCVFAETPRPLEDLATRVAQQAAGLRDAGADLPDRFVQSYLGGGRRTDGVVVLLDRESAATATDDVATATLTRPARCRADLGDEPPLVAFDARHLLGRWLQVRAGLREPRTATVIGRG